MFDSMLSRGMTPNVTLHHFTAPQWFMDIGGWTKAENIHIFVEYAIKVGLVIPCQDTVPCCDGHMCVDVFHDGLLLGGTATGRCANGTHAGCFL
jgi:hypothetical protein